MEYIEQLLTIDWVILSINIKNRDGKCQYCGTTKRLNTHHLVYLPNKKAWEYEHNYLITLCENCHKVEHMALDYFKHIKLDIREPLLNGLLAIDLFNKIYLNKEKLYFMDYI